VKARDAFHASDAVSLHEQLKGEQRLLVGHSLLMAHTVKFFVVAVRLAAPPTAITLEPVAALSGFGAVDPAVVAGHFGLAFFGNKRQNDSGRKNPAFGASPSQTPRQLTLSVGVFQSAVGAGFEPAYGDGSTIPPSVDRA